MTPAIASAATVSPPPATLINFPAPVNSAAFFASATVARSKGGVSNAPTGPFHTSVRLASSAAALAAAECAARSLRVFQRGAGRFPLLRHVFAGGGRQQMRQRLDRGMRPVRRREGVVDIRIAQCGEGAGESGVVGLLALVEAQVFEQ